MNISTTAPPSFEIKPGRLLALIGGVAAVAATVTWAVLAFGVDNGSGGQAQGNAPAQPLILSSPIPMTGYLDGISGGGRPTVVAGPTAAPSPVEQHARSVHSIMDLTPGDLAGGGLWGYALPSPQSGPTVAGVLSSLRAHFRLTSVA